MAGQLALTPPPLPAQVRTIPRGLDLHVPSLADDPATPDRVALGGRLFFDGILSADGRVRCATCHDPARAFTDGRPIAIGVGGQRAARGAPSVLNVAYATRLFWDGRGEQLERVVLAPIANPREMALPIEEAIRRLGRSASYVRAFGAAFEDGLTERNLGRALAAYLRTLLSGDAAVDRYLDGDTTALSPAARRGYKLFVGRAGCSACHLGPLFTDDGFHNTGVGWGGGDPGRHRVTGLEADRGRFNTPSLRNVALTAPYMHDGSKPDLASVIAFYEAGGNPNPNLDRDLVPFRLEAGERADLVAFLEALTGVMPPTPAGAVPSPPSDAAGPAAGRVVVSMVREDPGAPDSLGGWLSFAVGAQVEQSGRAPVVLFRSAQRLLHADAAPPGAGLTMQQAMRLATYTRATVILRGTYRRSGDSLQLRLELRDATTGVLRSGPGRSTGALGGLDRLVESALADLWGLTVAEPPVPPLRAVPGRTAYEAFERGLRAWAAGDPTEALRHLDAAAATSHDFVSARLEALYVRWVRYALADAQSTLDDLGRLSWRPTERESIEVALARAEIADDVEEALAQARRYARHVPEDLYPLGTFALRGNYLAEARTAFASAPSDSPFGPRSLDYSDQYARVLHMLGRYAEEEGEATRIAAIFPASSVPSWTRARAMIGAGRVGEALALMRQLTPLPDTTRPGRTGQWGNAARELRAHGARDSAEMVLAHVIRALEAVPDSAAGPVRDELAAHYIMAERWSEARPIVAELLDEATGTGFWELWNRKNQLGRLACLDALLADEGAARRGIDALEVLRSAVPDSLRTRMGAAVDVAQGRVLACLGEHEAGVALIQRGMQVPGAPGYGFGYGFGPWVHRDGLMELLGNNEAFRRLMAPREPETRDPPGHGSQR